MIGARGSIPALAGEPSCSTIPAFRSRIVVIQDWNSMNKPARVRMSGPLIAYGLESIAFVDTEPFEPKGGAQ